MATRVEPEIKLVRCSTPRDIILVSSSEVLERLIDMKPACGHPHTIVVIDSEESVEFITPKDKV